MDAVEEFNAGGIFLGDIPSGLRDAVEAFLVEAQKTFGATLPGQVAEFREFLPVELGLEPRLLEDPPEHVQSEHVRANFPRACFLGLQDATGQLPFFVRRRVTPPPADWRLGTKYALCARVPEAVREDHAAIVP